MNSFNSVSRFSKTFRILGLACASVLLTPLALRADNVATRPLADSAPNLPLEKSFEKASNPDGGRYVLKLKNTSSSAIKVTASILRSVAFHDNTKDQPLAPQKIEAGDSWSIPGLASADKVTLTADGFAPLEVTVP